MTDEDKQDPLRPSTISVAYEKLFGGGRGVQYTSRSRLRFIPLGDDIILIEQNPKTKSEWARLAKAGHKIAWAMRDGEYLARVVDGEVVILKEA